MTHARPAASGAKIVRTVLGDVSPDTLGFVLAHEHIVARPPVTVTDPDLVLDDVAAAEAELRAYAAVGGGAVVEMTTVDYGRDVAALAAISAAASVHVIAATGFNQGKFADPIVAAHTDEEIVDWLVAEVEVGALPYAAPEGFRLQPEGHQGGGRTAVRAGLIKASSGPGGPSDGELRGLRAAAQAQLVTGAPISTHTTKADWAFEQAELLTAAGVPPRKVLIGHLDFRPDAAWLTELAATGVMIGLDQFSKSKYLSDERRVGLVTALAAAGYLGSVLLSGDLARRSYWLSYGPSAGPSSDSSSYARSGTRSDSRSDSRSAPSAVAGPGAGPGPGLPHIPTTVREMLRAEGFGAAELDELFVRNAAGWLSFEPRDGGGAAPSA